MKSNFFDIRRFWLFLRLELYKSRKGIAMVIAVTFGMLFFMGLLLSLLVEQHTTVFQHEDGYAFTLIAGGLVVSSLAFHDLGNALKRYNYLLLPVSAFEKFLCMWLLTTVGWVVVYTIIFTIYTWLANPLGEMIFSKVTFLDFNPLQASTVTFIKIYIALQGIFLVGAAHFKGYVFPKTFLVLILFIAFCGTLIYFSLKDIFLGDHYCVILDDGNVDCGLINAFVVHPIWGIIQGFFWYVLAPLTWVVAYLGLKGQEV